MSDSLAVYTKDVKAWFEDEDEGWAVGWLTDKSVDGKTATLVFALADRKVTWTHPLDQLDSALLPHLKNPPILEGIDDLANLSYLHEY
ncbi:MAG: hypothetical protein SGCHY_004751, partial [Lobulomycetales sp.]